MSRKYWTKQEEQFIRDNIAIKTVDDFSKYFEIPKEKIADKIHKMGLNSKKARNIIWSEAEDDLLKIHFEYAPKNFILKLFPNRSWCAILQRGIKTLGLKRISQDHVYIDYNFFEKWTSLSAYIYGFIMADGHIHYGDQNYLQLEVALKDKDILYKIKEAMSFDGNVSINKTARLQINNKKIIKDLIDKEMPTVDKSHNSIFPSTLPENLYRDFCRGVIDGDGWSSISSNSYSIGLCGNYQLISKVKEVFPEDCSNNNIRKDKNSYCWRFNIKGSKAIKIAQWLYSDSEIYLTRKYDNFCQALLKFSVPGETQGRTQLETQ